MKKQIVILTLTKLLTIAALCESFAQTEDFSRKIDSLLVSELSDGLPGGAVAVLSGKDVLYQKTIGIMDTETARDIDETTLFDMASIAKPFTAFAVMLLEEEDKLDLDKDIRIYLPDLPPYEYQVTTRHLLQHTSGIASTDWLRLLSDLAFDEDWHHDDEIRILTQYSQLNFEPNTRHLYSNGGYALLGSLIEHISGMPFGEFLHQRIFKPLEMETALIYSHPGMELMNDAGGYRITNDMPVKVSSTADYSYGSGNLWTSLDDMIKWGHNFFSPKVGNAEMTDRIMNKYNTLENGDTLSYTYGFYVRKYKGVKMVDHQGGVPGFRSYFMIFPDDNLILVALFNNESLNVRSLVNGIADLLLADRIVEQPVKPRIEVDVNLEKAERIAGTYELADGMELTFAVEQDTFWLLLPGDHKFQLFAEDDYSYFLKVFEAGCSFTVSETGEVDHMSWHQRGQTINGSRVTERIPLSIDEIERFAGHYILADLDMAYPVSFEDGVLYIHTPSTFKRYMGIEKLELSHVSGDRFLTSGFGILEFTRDESGQVNGFLMPELGRLHNVRFQKK